MLLYYIVITFNKLCNSATASYTHNIITSSLGFPSVIFDSLPPPSTQDIEPPSHARHVLLSDGEPEFMDNGSRPAERHRIHQAREPTAMAEEGCVRRFHESGWSRICGFGVEGGGRDGRWGREREKEKEIRKGSSGKGYFRMYGVKTNQP